MYNIFLLSKDSTEKKIARRQLAFKDINSNSWFTEVKSLLWKYDLPILLEFYLRLLFILFWYKSMDVVYLVCIFLYWGNLYSDCSVLLNYDNSVCKDKLLLKQLTQLESQCRRFIYNMHTSRYKMLIRVKSSRVSRRLYTFEFNKILSHFKNKISHLLYHLKNPKF
jgi:hypothetical protein